jgi:hypothetical protein
LSAHEPRIRDAAIQRAVAYIAASTIVLGGLLLTIGNRVF